ncbi:MAG: TusE/DsrC/DsvC family sulfur relay protein [Porticoccaceae bacterium]|jgi:tRNA 2-thiouridine synthesizing protein E
MYNIDEEGFLINPADWDTTFARETASSEGIDLTAERWQLVEQTRAFYNDYGFSPSMRPLVKYIGMNLGADKGKSIYLMKLFPPSPAKILSKLAGLHKPKNCL